MSNREALRKLSSKVPPKPEIERIINGLRDEPDLAAAITGAAIAEAALERLLISKFKSRNGNLIGQLFKNRGPLMDFPFQNLGRDCVGSYQFANSRRVSFGEGDQEHVRPFKDTADVQS